MQRIIILFALVSLILCITPYNHESVVAISGDSTHLREYNATWFPAVDPRVIILEGIEITKTGQNSLDVDAVVFFLDDYNQTTLFFEYFEAEAVANNQGNLTKLAEAAFVFAMRAYVCFEYVDNNGIDGLQLNTSDQITGWYDLSSLELEWKPMDINHTEITGADGNQYKVWFVTIQTKDEVFLMRFVVAGTPIEVSNVELTPDSMKIDFEIQWFTDKHVPAPWTTGPSDAADYPDAQAGMVLVMAAAAETFSVNSNQTNNNGNQNNGTFQFAATGYTGFFSWETNVSTVISGEQGWGAVALSVSGTDGNTTYTGGFEEEWIVRLCIFSFAGYRPESVVWDPELGTEIVYPTTPGMKSNGNMLMVPILAVFMVILALFH